MLILQSSFMLEQLPNILIWTILWVTSWGIFFLLVYKKNLDYIKYFIWTATYFLSIAIITSLVFRDYITRVLQNFTTTPLVILGIVVLIHIILYIYLPRYFKEPKNYFEKYPKRQYLKINPRRLVSKSMDILSQQVFVILLVMFLQDADLTLNQIIIAFVVIFGLVHMPLILTERGAWPSWYFIVSSILSAIIFPTLILKIQYGFVYSYIFHWTFYTFTAIGFWTLYPRYHRNEP